MRVEVRLVAMAANYLLTCKMIQPTEVSSSRNEPPDCDDLTIPSGGRDGAEHGAVPAGGCRSRTSSISTGRRSSVRSGCAWRWPEGFICPRCQGCWHSEFRRQQRLYFQCSGCRYQCSLVAGTVFESSKVPLTGWFLAMHLMTRAKNNVAALELMRHLGVSYPTAWLLKYKIIEVMTLREANRRLTGRVEIDDSYLGGEVQGGKAGRGSPNKIPFVAAVQTTESGQSVLVCLSQRPFTKESIQAFANQSLAAPGTLVSDGLGCFTAVCGTGLLHEPHITGGGVASAKHP